MAKRDVLGTDGRKIAEYDSESGELEIKIRDTIYTVETDDLKKDRPKKARAKSVQKFIRND